MKQVDLQEFQKHALKYLIGDEEVAVELNGRVLGRYVPDLQERKQAREAMQRFEAILEKIMAETGETEEELSDFFNPKKPLPPVRKYCVS